MEKLNDSNIMEFEENEDEGKNLDIKGSLRKKKLDSSPPKHHYQTSLIKLPDYTNTLSEEASKQI
jgi:hypothetical protein